jgi:hypothetical protein
MRSYAVLRATGSLAPVVHRGVRGVLGDPAVPVAPVTHGRARGCLGGIGPVCASKRALGMSRDGGLACGQRGGPLRDGVLLG